MSESDERAWQERLGLEAAVDLPGFYTFPRPEPGFSTLSASPEALARYGVPPRPDADANPVAFRRWHGLYGRITEFVDPQLKARPRLRHSTLVGASETLEEGTSTTGNWAGHVLVAAKGHTFTGVGGMWVVPSASQPHGGPFAGGEKIGSTFLGDINRWESSAWVGIDGADTIDGVTSKEIFQAGTEHDLFEFEGFGADTWKAVRYMWTEWYPQPGAIVGGVSVSPGDLVSVEMRILQRLPNVSVGTASLLNLTSGAFAPVFMFGPGTVNPKGPSFIGDSAEWIVETPQIGMSGTSPLLSELPYLGIVSFFESFAADSTGASVSGATGTTTTDVSPNLYYLSMENSFDGPDRTGTGTGVVVAKHVEKAFGVQTLPLVLEG